MRESIYLMENIIIYTFFINIHFYGVELTFLDIETTMIILGILEGLKVEDDYVVEVSFVSML